MTEVESRKEGHVANNEAKRGVRDVKACQPEVSHIPELAAIVLTCRGKKQPRSKLLPLVRLQGCRQLQLLPSGGLLAGVKQNCPHPALPAGSERGVGAVSRKPDTFSFFPAARLCLTYTAKGYAWNAPPLSTLPHFSRP